MSKELFRSLPSIERLLATAAAARAVTALGRDRARDLLREITDQLRREIASGAWPDDPATTGDGQPTEEITVEIERRLEAQTALAGTPSLRRVVNATGVILHTNLGRAPLARAAIERILEVASSYSNLEYDLDRGERGHRESHCRQLLARLAGSESAIVTNNNAAAVLLVLNTLAEGGEVIVSRGEMIEIGGSFRIPDVMEKSGARLKEVGTTNRTRISDYERAITSDTRLILRVHPSNYRIIGFTERPSVAEIAELARRANVPSFEDLGSGCLIDLAPCGVKDEPTVAESIRAGISVVSFSGDKMLGGPQSGVIAGSSRIIDRVQKNPLMRALRVDKMTYAALEATLRIYERGAAEKEIPVISRIAAGPLDIATRAESFAVSVRRATSGRVRATLEEGASVIGGGSAPEARLPTVLVALEDQERSAAALEERLRHHSIPIIARTERDRVLIDLRTVREDEEAIIIEALERLAQPAPRGAASM
jgi:L-seryl-tRNA(Ser) seleniumtransferase